MEYSNEEREPATVPDSFSLSEEKTLTQWKFELRTLPRKHWSNFYSHFLGSSISNYPAFYRALKLYDGSFIFEAVLAASRQELNGDPLAYVLKVAHEMWKEEQRQLESRDDYEKEIVHAETETKKRNEELRKKLERLEK